jgi:CopG family transcriptional regulator, nickel-responsive regulator
MGELSRIGVAIDSDLLDRFDEHIAKRGYTNRSEAFRDMIREDLVEHASESPEARVIGTVTLVYDHHVRMLSDRLTDLQHDAHHIILSTLHVHLDHDNCLEVIVVKGKSAEVRRVADALISTKGVKLGRLTITGADL